MINQQEYLKCPCKECGNSIEFPLSIERTTIACPHCGQWTELLTPETEAADQGKAPKKIGLIASMACFLLLIGVLAYVVVRTQHSASKPAVAVETTQKIVASKPIVKVPPAPPVVTNDQTNILTKAPPAKPREKSLDDLKSGAVILEKTQGSSLVYAVGTLKNDSDYQRFGVRVELDLFNAKGKKIASAQDYKDILEPHKDWSFHALIPDSKTVQAKVAEIKED